MPPKIPKRGLKVFLAISTPSGAEIVLQLLSDRLDPPAGRAGDSLHLLKLWADG